MRYSVVFLGHTKSQDAYSTRRVPLLPFWLTISISNVSTKSLTINACQNAGRNVRNGDCPPKGEEWHTPGRNRQCIDICRSIGRCQPTADIDPVLTNLPFHDFPNYFNHESTISGSTFWENREKAGFVKKRGVSCRRLVDVITRCISHISATTLQLLAQMECDSNIVLLCWTQTPHHAIMMLVPKTRHDTD